LVACRACGCSLCQHHCQCPHAIL